MRIGLSLVLPREGLSIPLARHMFASSMSTVGVHEECVDDIKVALTEACTNALRHADNHDHYDVMCYIDDTRCVIQVIDRGGGFDSSAWGAEDTPIDSEAGRGIQLMRQLVDQVQFERAPRGGTIVYLEKLLTWREDAPMREAPDAGR